MRGIWAQGGPVLAGPQQELDDAHHADCWHAGTTGQIADTAVSAATHPVDILLLGLGEVMGGALDGKASLIATDDVVNDAIALGLQGGHVSVTICVLLNLQGMQVWLGYLLRQFSTF